MGELLFWSLATVALATFFVETAFPYVAFAKKLLKADIEIPLDIKLIAYIWLAVGYPSDWIFNWTRGWLMLREFPREILFSSRIQRWIDNPPGGRNTREYRKVLLWAQILNLGDENHIKRVPRG